MIVKILDKRGGSAGSASSLKYIAGQGSEIDGIDTSSIDNSKNDENCRLIDLHNIDCMNPTEVLSKDDSGNFSFQNVDLINSDLTDVINEMDELCSMNDRVKDSISHFVLCFSADEFKVGSNKQGFDNFLKDITNRFMSDMGYDNCKYMAVVHEDTKNPHIHIITTNVQMNNKFTVVDDSFEKYKAMDVARQIEYDFGLKEMHMPDEGKKLNRDKGDYVRESAGLNTSINKKEEIGGIIDYVVERLNEPDMKQGGKFEVKQEDRLQTMVGALNKYGVEVKFQFKNGEATGISYIKDGNFFSGSKLGFGGRYNLAGLKKRGIEIGDKQKPFCEMNNSKVDSYINSNSFPQTYQKFDKSLVPTKFKTVSNQYANKAYKHAETNVFLKINMSQKYFDDNQISRARPAFSVPSICGTQDFYFRINIVRPERDSHRDLKTEMKVKFEQEREAAELETALMKASRDNFYEFSVNDSVTTLNKTKLNDGLCEDFIIDGYGNRVKAPSFEWFGLF